MRAFCDEWEQTLGVKITLSHEDEPLGTAGPLALAKDILDDGSNEPFFVMNSDVICAYPLADMMAFHKRNNAEATLLVTKVRRHRVQRHRPHTLACTPAGQSHEPAAEHAADMPDHDISIPVRLAQ